MASRFKIFIIKRNIVIISVVVVCVHVVEFYKNNLL